MFVETRIVSILQIRTLYGLKLPSSTWQWSCIAIILFDWCAYPYFYCLLIINFLFMFAFLPELALKLYHHDCKTFILV